MAKKKRLEQDPSIDPQTGKKRERRIRVDIGDKINIGKWGSILDDVDLADTTKKIMEDAAGGHPLFGGRGRSKLPPERGSGRIFVDGGGRGDFEKSFGASTYIKDLMDHMRNMGIDWGNMEVGEDGLYPRIEPQRGDMHWNDAVASMIFKKAIEVWEHPINWTFGVGYNAGQETFWFTARYHDDEGTMLVEETIEVADQVMSERNWDESCLILEGELEKMHTRCQAEIAMFEEDG